MLRQKTKIFLWRRRKTEEEKRKIFGEGKYFVGRGEEKRRRKMEKYLEKGNIFSGGKGKYLAGGGEEKQGKKRRKIFAEGKYLFPEEKEKDESNWKRKNGGEEEQKRKRGDYLEKEN